MLTQIERGMSDLADKDWLLSIGFLPDGEMVDELTVSLGEVVVEGEFTQLIICTHDNSAAIECYSVNGQSNEIVSVGTYRTRGEVLALCNGLKAWIHEPVPPCAGCGRNVHPIDIDTASKLGFAVALNGERCMTCNWPNAT